MLIKGETLEEAARGEIREEAGFKVLVCQLGVGERLNYEKTAWKVTHYFLFITKETDPKPTDPLHRQQIVWLPIDDVRRMMWPEQRRLVEENRDKIKQLVHNI